MPETLKYIQTLRRDIIVVRRAVWPLREVVASMQKRDTPLLASASDIYFTDIYDHVIQVMDNTETFREILSNIFDIYLSSVNNRMNEVMKVLTIIATIILPMSFVSGLYGMNFELMPELKWKYGYPMALLMMVSIAGGMLMYFRKKKWL
jgi:magnesium transporter